MFCRLWKQSAEDVKSEYCIATNSGTEYRRYSELCLLAKLLPKLAVGGRSHGNGRMIHRIRVILPFHLRNLAQAGEEVELSFEGPATFCSVLDSLEDKFPMLRGTIRDHVTKQRRPFIRYFACRRDYSHDPPETMLPAEVLDGAEPFRIVGAIAGG